MLVLTGLIESGHVRRAVDRTCPLERTPASVQYMHQRRARGKVVVTLTTIARPAPTRRKRS
ncbi:zinc-binding dehydrogenase [Sphaerisporangium dianthi]|uniref:Zinc-binding dehydrogenase n=1 Tax=Sphaerisporangium dianthi TaxID=1436120 RepID=A0ABV9CNI4_9ACTN